MTLDGKAAHTEGLGPPKRMRSVPRQGLGFGDEVFEPHAQAKVLQNVRPLGILGI